MSKFKYIVLAWLLVPVISGAMPVRQELDTGWEFRQARLSNWYPATVPGVVHTDLMDNGIIEDPFYRLNERGVQWVDKEDWIYRTEFDVSRDIVSSENIAINFYGLDTYADVSLNGQKIISADNMFRKWSADIKDILKEKDNLLEVYFHSPIKVAMPLYDALPYHYVARNDQSANGGLFDKALSPFTRKAGYHYGWDWGPRLVTSGIWRKVEIEAWDSMKIEDFTIRTSEIGKSRAEMECTVSIISSEDCENAVITVKDGQTGEIYGTAEKSLEKGRNDVNIAFSVRNPRLWWCNGMGKPELYEFSASVGTGNRICDESTCRTGIRTVHVEKENDRYGRSLKFLLNGVPVFCKGANYIPSDNFLPRVTRDKYRKTIQDAADVNMNMLRVWGGGIYENDVFYELCDSLGIMVWQDFMFACSVYPAEGELLENIRQEAIYNVCRLRNHPCIVYWCGNNECQDSWLRRWHKEMEAQSPGCSPLVWKQYENQYYNVLADVVSEYGNGIGYQPTSPFSDFGVQSNDHEGDRHYWGIWHGKRPISDYNIERSRFFSEYGFQSFPAYASVLKFAPDEKDHDIYSEVMMSHQRGGMLANSLIETYLVNEYHKPDGFREFLYVSQVLQGDAIKTAIEAHRRDKGYCWGTLFWQHNDCWPVASWSSRDWYGTWKAQHYFSKAAFDNLLVSGIEQNDTLGIYIVSDQLKPESGTLTVKTISLESGKTVNSLVRKVKTAPNCSKKAVSLPVSAISGGLEKEDYIISLVFDTGDRTVSNIFYPCKQKDMAFPEADITFSTEMTDGIYTVTLSSGNFARAVYLTAGSLPLHFSDNFFDLLPGEVKTVSAETDSSKEELDSLLEVMSLTDTY